jgi:hypothetical protein
MRAITFRPRNTLGLDLPLARAQRRRRTAKSSCHVGDSSQSPRHLRSRVAFVLAPAH